MIDLPMMSRLIDALPPHGRMIFLGDRDQLASVEAGAVLGISVLSSVTGLPGTRPPAQSPDRERYSCRFGNSGSSVARQSVPAAKTATVSAAIPESVSWPRRLIAATKLR